MASVGRGTSGVSYDANSFQNRLNNLRGKFVASGVITAADWNELISLWNTFNDHTHTVSDLYGIRDYGDGLGNPGYADSGSYENDTMYGPSNLAGDIGGVQSDTLIYASKQRELAAAMGNDGASHYHGWDDRSS